MTLFRIGELAKRSHTSNPTIRYYEQIGLLRTAPRQSGGQRLYSPADADRLSFIRRCREFGFGIAAIRDLVALMDGPRCTCDAVHQLGEQHLQAVHARITELKTLEIELQGMLHHCSTACFSGPVADCTIIPDLQRHGALQTKGNPVVQVSNPRRRAPSTSE
jgi:DNA-binding transcriptional MerR regulator